MMSKSKVIERARKLLALADRNANENEAALAAAKARSLLLHHDLTISSVEDIEDQAPSVVEEAVEGSQRFPSWRRMLLSKLSEAFGCGLVKRTDYQTYNGRRYTELTLVGAPSDVALARESYGYLAEVVQRLARRHCAGKGRRFANAFRVGCAQRVGARLAEHEASVRAGLQEVSTSTGRELVYCKEQALASHMAQYGQGRAWSAMYSDTLGYLAGRDAADSVSMSRQVESAPPEGPSIAGRLP